MAHRKKSKSGLQPVPEQAGKQRQVRYQDGSFRIVFLNLIIMIVQLQYYAYFLCLLVLLGDALSTTMVPYYLEHVIELQSSGYKELFCAVKIKFLVI